MGSFGCMRFIRPRFLNIIDIIGGVDEPTHREVLGALLHEQERTLENDRSNFWAQETDIGLKAKVELLQTNISYKFGNPWHAKQAILHSSMNSLTDNPSSFTHFKTMEFHGDGVMRLAAKWLLTNTGPNVSSSPRHPQFLTNQALSALIETTLSDEYLARVGVKLKLWDILKFAPTDDQINACEVEEFLDSVREDRYDVKAPKILADAVEATAGSVYVDSDSIEVFSRVWESLFFFEENPMYSLLTTPRSDLLAVSPVFRMAKDKITNVLFSHDPSLPRPSTPVVLGSGITKLAAVVEALNRTP